MWPLKWIVAILVIMTLTACSQGIVIDLAVLPVVPAAANIKQSNHKAQNPNPQSCKIPCSLTVEDGSNVEVRVDAPGYYPATVQFDYEISVQQKSRRTDGGNHLPLVIPLIKKTEPKDNLHNL